MDEPNEGDSEEDKPVYFAKLANGRRKYTVGDDTSQRFYEKYVLEINNPNPLRSKILTFHLCIEYWLNRIGDAIKLKLKNYTFNKKIETLNKRGLLNKQLYSNIKKINRIRNIYTHNLDANGIEVSNLLEGLTFSNDFITSSRDKFEAVSIQTMFELEGIYLNLIYPQRSEFYSDEETKQKLIDSGKLFWQSCEILDVKKEGYDERYTLKCPYCCKGEIIKIHEGMPGFKDSYFIPCQRCGLTGDGSTLLFNSIKGLK